MADQREASDFESEICEKFSVNQLNATQKKTLNAYLEGKDILVCSKTGSGKSLMYQSSILASGIRSPIAIVIVPLLSIMKEHVEKLNSIGFRATYIGKDWDDNAGILRGEYDYVYGSPEEFVANEKWRDMLRDIQQRVSCIVVDEAHTVINWGESKASEDPFRVWFSKIGELRSLCPDARMFAATATASASKRKSVMKSLCMNILKTKVIVESPDRNNIKLSVKCVKASHDPVDTFGPIINNLSVDMPRQLIFCKTINDCSLLYLTMRNFKDCGSDGVQNVSEDIVQMYHSRTLKSIQERVRVNMSDPNGCIRIPICTNAAGMGVNFSQVNNVMNYGPPSDIDTFLQQIGRAGRDGSQAHHLLLYHKRQLRNLDSGMLEYVKNSDKCRRDILLSNYSSSKDASLPGHLCCDVCAEECDCGESNCSEEFLNDFVKASCDFTDDEYEGDTVHRVSSEEQKDQLKLLLVEYKEKQLDLDSKLLVEHDVVHGFSGDLVDELVEKCDFLTSCSDIMAKTLVASHRQARDVADIFDIVFGGTFFCNDPDSDCDWFCDDVRIRY